MLGWLLALLLPAPLSAQAAWPVDTLTRQDLLRTGRTELAQILQALLPSVNFPRPSGTGGSDHRRPATLRGLGADQFVVLVNGQRRVESALVPVGAGIARGQSMVDLNAIPVSAIERIEVSGPGGSAQHGFGAVAGVIDIILRESAAPELRATLGTTTAGDGSVLQAAGNQGLRWGPDGFLQLSAELRSRGATNRALPDRRPQYFPGDPRNDDPALLDRVNQRFGDPESNELAGVLNASKRIRGSLTAYGFASLSRRSGEAGELWRTASDDRTVRALYPDGFLPLIAPKLFDGSATGGLRGRFLGFRWDASVGYARNSIRFDLEHSANASLGPQSPTRFDAGSLSADQFSLGFELARRVRIAQWLPALRLELGGQHRSDGYRIEPGEPASYRFGAVPIQDGPHAGGIAQPGAQGFPGFRPSDATLVRRGMVTGFGALSTVIRERLSLAAAGRVEYYRGLGSLGAYQASAALGPIGGVVLHGSFGTGVRVPSLTQSWFSSSSTKVIGQFGFEDRTVPVANPLARVLGAPPLRPEHSRTFSLGGSWAGLRALRLEAAFYRITGRDRVILSGSFDDFAVQNYLNQKGYVGIGGVRFFTNALATRTTGVDAAASYRLTVGDAALRLRAALNHNVTHVTLTDSIPGLLAPFTKVLFDRVERARLERGQPRDNVILSGEATRGAWTVLARGQRFGSVTSFGKPADGSLDQTYGAKWINDLNVSYRRGRMTWTLGADNLFDSYPDRNKFGDASAEGNSNFGMFPYSSISPFGFGGRFVYVRVSWQSGSAAVRR